jgi:hypothetical protein
MVASFLLSSRADAMILVSVHATWDGIFVPPEGAGAFQLLNAGLQ